MLPLHYRRSILVARAACLYDARVRSVSNTVAMSGCMGIYEVVVIHFRMSCTETFIKLVKQIPLLARAIYIINGCLMFC